jgi:hypothetical protein
MSKALDKHSQHTYSIPKSEKKEKVRPLCDDGYGARRHAIYDALVAEHKVCVGKAPGKAQGVKLWDQAGNDALVEGVSNDASERRSKRVQRQRA